MSTTFLPLMPSPRSLTSFAMFPPSLHCCTYILISTTRCHPEPFVNQLNLSILQYYILCLDQTPSSPPFSFPTQCLCEDTSCSVNINPSHDHNLSVFQAALHCTILLLRLQAQWSYRTPINCLPWNLLLNVE